MKLIAFATSFMLLATVTGCAESEFASGTNSITGKKSKSDDQKRPDPLTDPMDNDSNRPENLLAIGGSNFMRCSDVVDIPATSNPFLAAAADGTQINYGSGHIDIAPQHAPVLMPMSLNTCLVEGAKLFFDSSGSLNHGVAFADSGPDGNATENGKSSIKSHAFGSHRGIAQITSPINAMIGVFLDDGDPATKAAPSSLDFTLDSARNYLELKPEVRQLFFIGDGKTDDGQTQRIIVPAGASRLYIGIMDGYGWYNNNGALKSGVLVEVK